MGLLDSTYITTVESLELDNQSPIPSARTYHASCLVDKFMIVSGGESNNTDMNDMWALNILKKIWYQLEIQELSCFTAKRFHTISLISGNKVVTFGGCHSEYAHLNDVNVFDLDLFVQSDGENKVVDCVKLNFKGDLALPSTRWGHAAVTNDDKVYILGGRNEQDINDLHFLDFKTKKWTGIKIRHQLPKPRRRHSAVFISGSIIMFGGFDSEFFNDLHVLHLD